ncbi:MAG: LysM peptidoglycan-binding domain-containing protein [Candidatus Pelagadaptatus aseana]|uniref:lytic transglycosylase n=1 Tax=Candidatus Pelagadaptatus aseana TaxID=3120508 RepID=UPI0039B24A87
MTRITFLFSILAVFSLVGCVQTNHTSKVGHKQANDIEKLLSQAEIDKLCRTTHVELESFRADDYDLLWDRIRAGYGLKYQQHPRIDKHLSWYRKHPSYIKRVTERSERYLFYIVEQAEQRNMPLELALLPVVESAFDPFAYSHGSASGMWQFIASTGKHFGLEQNWWYDGRRDVMAATDAALDFLTSLHRRLDNDWLLALAAYNAGEGNVRKAIRRNKNAGKPTDFWSLRLPKETKAYVPQLLALSKVVMSPEQHGAELTPVANKPYFEAVDTGSQIDLAQAAQLAEISINDLYKLNPGFNRWATAPDGPHRLLVPVEKAETFRSNLNGVPPEQRLSWKRYIIRDGDSLISIAKKFNTQVSVLKDTNNLRGNTIRAGKALMIPVASASQNSYAYSQSQRVKKQADRYQGRAGNHKIEYRVRPGDSLWNIARKYNVSVRALAKWNSMAPKDTLRENQKLVIWTNNKQLASTVPSPKGIIRKVSYRVRNGDSLARIAGKFNLSVTDIARWNPVDTKNYIHPGQSLTLFVDVTRIN